MKIIAMLFLLSACSDSHTFSESKFNNKIITIDGKKYIIRDGAGQIYFITEIKE